MGAAQRKCGRNLIRVPRFERRPCLTALSKSCDPPTGNFHRVCQTIWLSPAIGQCNLEFRKIDGGSGCPDPPSSTLSQSYLAIVLVHSKLAKTLSFDVGTNGAASTFDAAALAISVGASDGSRKRCWTATFTARVTTQT